MSRTTTTIVDGIVWAVERHANVINMSINGDEPQAKVAIWQDAVDCAHRNGVVVVVSAGNYNEYLDPADTNYHLPAELDHVIVVGATNYDENCRPFPIFALNCNWTLTKFGSGWGPALDVMAPGSTDILTTALNGQYKLFGTSAATPFVSGLAALMLSVDPSLTPDQIEDLIKQNAHHLGAYDEGSPSNYSFGWGRIDAFATVNAAAPDTLPPSGSWVSPADGVSVGAVVNLSGIADDNKSGVAQVQFTAYWDGWSDSDYWYVIATLPTTAGETTYSYSWNPCDAVQVPAGDILLGMDITDNVGNVAYSPAGERTIHKPVECNSETTSNMWTGAAGADAEGHFQWSNPGNWSQGRVPIATDVVTIEFERRGSGLVL